jgi:hypothetical protein
VSVGGLLTEGVPVIYRAIAPPKPSQCNEIDLIVFIVPLMKAVNSSSLRNRTAAWKVLLRNLDISKTKKVKHETAGIET